MRSFFLFFSFFLLPFYAIATQELDSSFTPNVMGLTFGTTQKEVTEFMIPFSKRAPRKQRLQGGRVVLLTFDGVPDSLDLKEGKSHFFFFENKLSKIVFSTTPSYQNFINIKSKIQTSLGKRYSLGARHEIMDQHLKQYLATLNGNASILLMEQAIRASIEEGKTFFSYTWNDSQKELDIALSLKADSKNRSPTLTIHYDYLPFVANLHKKQQLNA